MSEAVRCKVCMWQMALENVKTSKRAGLRKYYGKMSEMLYETIGSVKDNRYRVLKICSVPHLEMANGVRKFWLADKAMLLNRLEDRHRELQKEQYDIFEKLKYADPVQHATLTEEFEKLEKQLSMLLVNINRVAALTRRKERDSTLLKRMYKPRVKKWQKTGEIRFKSGMVIKIKGPQEDQI